MIYYMTYTYEGGQWNPQFGDDDRDNVAAEAEQWIDDPRNGCWGPLPKSHVKTVTFPRVPTQKQVVERAANIPAPKG